MRYEKMVNYFLPYLCCKMFMSKCRSEGGIFGDVQQIDRVNIVTLANW